MAATTMPNWRITSVPPMTDFSPGVGPTPGFSVNFTTDTGLNGGVFIPAARISDANYVGAQVSQLVAQLHAIHTLTGGPGQ